ncbi:MAG: type VI secretion system tube protein Hcp [Gemmatimonadetes bacterium]|nr:type VI secretion system tube protein Hcp [Gemmatimonadota bacterium]NNM05449.1 type VI secretion system tube protein Hcp [Gemmatimonadota bacterium]
MEGKWDAYLTVEGVTGESERAGHEEEIELLSFSFGASNPSSIGTGGGGGIGTVDIQSFNFEKHTDAASADMFKHCCAGKHFPSGKVTLYKAGGDGGAVDYLIFEFEEIYVDDIQWSGTAGGGIPTEIVSFSFAKIVVTYNQQDSAGAKAGSYMGSWNLKTKEP